MFVLLIYMVRSLVAVKYTTVAVDAMAMDSCIDTGNDVLPTISNCLMVPAINKYWVTHDRGGRGKTRWGLGTYPTKTLPRCTVNSQHVIICKYLTTHMTRLLHKFKMTSLICTPDLFSGLQQCR
jgi:hypothetical protein